MNEGASGGRSEIQLFSLAASNTSAVLIECDCHIWLDKTLFFNCERYSELILAQYSAAPRPAHDPVAKHAVSK